MLIQLGHRFDFIFRQEARFKFQPQFPGDCRCCAWIIACKDLRLVLSRGAGLVQALLLGLLLIFVFSLSRETGSVMSAQGAATIFWLASAFCQVLCFNMLYGLEETNGARAGLLLLPAPVQSVWLGKALAGLVMLLIAQLIFLPASVVFLGQSPGETWSYALLALILVDVGMTALGSLLGALSQGQAAENPAFHCPFPSDDSGTARRHTGLRQWVWEWSC